MESIYLLIPLSVLLVGGILCLLWWAVGSGQFDDLEGPGMRILQDDDRVHTETPESQKNTTK